MGQLSWVIIPRHYLLQIKSKEQKTHCLFAHSTRLLDSLSVSNTGSDEEPLAADTIFNPINKNSLGSREWKGNESVPTPWNLSSKTFISTWFHYQVLFFLTLSNPLFNLYLYVCPPIKLKAPWSRDHFCTPIYII